MECSYEDCQREAEFRCVVCKKHYCAFHIYERRGYICTYDFNEPNFESESGGYGIFNAFENQFRFDTSEDQIRSIIYFILIVAIPILIAIFWDRG